MNEPFTFAGFDFPRNIPQLYPNRKNYTGKMVSGKYRHAPLPLTRDNQSAGFYLALNNYRGTYGDFQPGLRWQWCDEVEGVDLRHTGWWADDFQSDKIRGMVFRLPKGRGFLIGWSMGPGMCGEVDYFNTYTSEVKAAYAADREAERVAEYAREASEAAEAAEREREQQEEQVQEHLAQAGWLL